MNEPKMIALGGRRRGRPPRAGVRASSRVEFLVTTDERKELQQVAAENRVPLATVIRDAVLEFVSDYRERSVIFTPSGDKFKRGRPPQ